MKMLQSLLMVGGFQVPRPVLPSRLPGGNPVAVALTMFHSAHGRPFPRFVSLSKSTYWPDDRPKARQCGEQSLGMRVLLPVTTFRDGRSHVVHRPARVARYNPDTNDHLVYYEDTGEVAWDCFNNRQVIVQESVENTTPLTFSEADVGRHIEVFWAGSRRYFPGRIAAFVPTPGDGKPATDGDSPEAAAPAPAPAAASDAGVAPAAGDAPAAASAAAAAQVGASAGSTAEAPAPGPGPAAAGGTAAGGAGAGAGAGSVAAGASIAEGTHPTGFLIVYKDGEKKWYLESNLARRQYRLVDPVPRYIPAADFADGGGDGFMDDPATAARPRTDNIPPCNSSTVSVFVDEFPQAPDVYASRPPAAQFQPSMYLIDSVNHFGFVGGFHAMLERLCGRPHPPSFWVLNRIVQCMYDTHALLHPAVFSAIVSTIRVAVFPTILALDDTSMKAVSKQALQMLCKVMELLLARAPVPAQHLPLPPVGAEHGPGTCRCRSTGS